MKKYTHWDTTRTYINSLPIGTIFTRRQLYTKIYGHEGDFLVRFECAIDHYRRYLTIINCLEIVGHGKYKKLKDVDLRLTPTNIQKICYDKSWRSWFVGTIDERIEMELENERRI